jgi:hypothetical protein
MKFESHRQPVASRTNYRRRMVRHFLYGAALIGFSLAMGTLGYCFFGKMPLIDGLYNASMILTGMGPVNQMTTNGGKLFASFYALYSGIAFLGAVTLTLAPIVHRFLHLLHVDERD